MRGSVRTAATGSVLLAYDAQSSDGTTRPATRRHTPEGCSLNIPCREKFLCHNELSGAPYLGAVCHTDGLVKDWLAGRLEKTIQHV